MATGRVSVPSQQPSQHTPGGPPPMSPHGSCNTSKSLFVELYTMSERDKGERVEVPYTGGAHYLCVPCDGGVELRVPFQSNTFRIKECLKQLGFRCNFDEKYWYLEPENSDGEKEEGLRFVLLAGDLPPKPHRTCKQKRRRSADDADEEDADEEEDEKGFKPVSFHGGLVWLQRRPSGYVVLTGAALENIRPMLTGILHFRQQLRPTPHTWRSSWPLTEGELLFVEAVLQHRQQKLQQAGFDDLVPLPEGYEVPPRFVPRDHEGEPIGGAFITRNGKPHNLGRQYFSNFEQGPRSSFIWADGTQAIGISGAVGLGDSGPGASAQPCGGAGCSSRQRQQQRQRQRQRQQQGFPHDDPASYWQQRWQHRQQQQQQQQSQPSGSGRDSTRQGAGRHQSGASQQPPGTPPKQSGSRASARAAGTGSGGARGASSTSSGRISQVQQEVERELKTLLRRCGHDFLRFVSALGVQYKPGPDRRSTLRSARQAALLAMHPDKLAAAGQDELRRAMGLQATQMLNQLWQQTKG